jgi:phage shock protein A
MGIFRRTSDLISANLNDLVERFENPEKLLRHALRDMEQSVATVSAAVARSIAAERLLAREQRRHQDQAAYWADNAAAAVDRGDDDLARRALARKLEHDRLAQAIERQLVEARAANLELRRQVEALREKHAAARRQLATLLARHATAAARRRLRAPGWEGRSALASVARFEHFQEKIELAEAEAVALAELELGTESWQADELASAESEPAVAAALAALKERRRP